MEAALHAYSQGDLAVHSTFSRYAPAVYSIKIDTPKEFVLQQYEDYITNLRQYQESYSNFVENATEVTPSNAVVDSFIDRVEKEIERIEKFSQLQQPFSGVGFAIHPHYMVTLSTVIKNATFGGSISIVDDYRRTLTATLHGMDELTGVAVLRVDDATFTNYVDISRNDPPLPEASYVVSIQRPYDLPTSPFSGMIGGYYRRLNPPMFKLERYIQSDITLYPGNEGAPVFSPAGQLIGMIAREYRVDGYPGLTFLVPSDILIDSAKEIIQNGKRDRGFISGVVFKQNLNGILIEEIGPDSPAKEAGLFKGDLIIGINGKAERDMRQFMYYMLSSKPNESLQILVQRGNETKWISVRTEQYPE
jgi:serine protease Do